MFAATLYALLPQTLIFPHQLSAEAWFVPFTIFGFYFAARWIIAAAPLAAPMSGLNWAFASLTRPTAFPFGLLAAIAIRPNASRKGVASYYLALLIPVGAWLMTVHAYTGQWSFGVLTSATPGGNLRTRVELIIRTFPPAARDAALQRYIEPAQERDGKLTIAEYSRFCAEFTGPCLAHVERDVFNYLFKSGVERITLDYFELIPEAERRDIQTERPGSGKGWSQMLRTQGALSTFKLYAGKYPFVILVSFVAAIAFGVLTIFFLTGSVEVLVSLVKRAPNSRRLMLALLALFPFCLFAASSVVASMQSRHRAAAEFAMCILAVHGWWAARQFVRVPATVTQSFKAKPLYGDSNETNADHRCARAVDRLDHHRAAAQRTDTRCGEHRAGCSAAGSGTDSRPDCCRHHRASPDLRR